MFRKRRRTYEIYKKEFENTWAELVAKGEREPLTYAQRCCNLVANKAKSLEEIRSYQQGSDFLIPKICRIR